MNITVLIKPVPYKSIVDNEGNVVRNKIKNIINKADKYALEEALRIKEKHNGTVTSISMTVKNNETVLKDIYSYGVDKAILLNDNIFAGSDTNSTSYILSKAIEKLNSDLIICGKVSSDSATSQVGIGVATKLDIPFIYNVCEIIKLTKEKIVCKVINDNKYEIIESNLPALIIVNDTINIPRIPTVSNRLLSQSKEIITWNSDDIEVDKSKCGFNGSVTSVAKVTPLNLHKDTKEIDGSINDKIERLLNITKDNCSSKSSCESFEITNKTNEEYWIYDNDFKSTCKLIAKVYKLHTNSKIVVISFNLNEELFKYGADKIIKVNIKKDDYITKSLTLSKLVEERKPKAFLFNKTSEGKIISAYLASKLNLGLSADCIKLEIDDQNRLVQIRSAYGGTMLANIISKNSYTEMATVLPDKETKIYNENNTGDIETVDSDVISDKIKILETKEIKESYLDKDIIIACGVGAIKQIDNLQQIAKKLNASFGITRDVYDKGYLNINYLIGQSGKITNSTIYIAFGISGALEHVVGINTDILISINTDMNAPIVKLSDYYINEDVNELIPLLLNKLEEDK